MGWRFRKSIKILPGIKVNIGKDGFSSVSVGTRGAHLTMGKNGTTVSAGIPGTGLSPTSSGSISLSDKIPSNAHTAVTVYENNGMLARSVSSP